jgi:hypothetical protein
LFEVLVKNMPRFSAILTFALVAIVAHAVDAGPLSGPDTFTPDYPAPNISIVADVSAKRPPLQLLGVSLSQGSGKLTGEAPRLSSGEPLVLTAFWKPSVTLASSVPFAVQFADFLSLLGTTSEFRAGPRTGEAAWQAGCVYRQDSSVDMADVARQFSGRGYLMLALKTTPGRGAVPSPIQLLPVLINPRAVAQALPQPALQRLLPGADRAIGQKVRLAYGAECTIAVPEAWQTGNRRLAVVSSLSYQNIPQGESVCDIVLNSGGNDTAVVKLTSGIMTSRCDHDVFAPGTLNHGKAQVFESRDSGTLDYQGRPVQLHTYIGTIELPAAPAVIRTLTFRCDAQVVLDILGVVLLP